VLNRKEETNGAITNTVEYCNVGRKKNIQKTRYSGGSFPQADEKEGRRLRQKRVPEPEKFEDETYGKKKRGKGPQGTHRHLAKGKGRRQAHQLHYKQ